MMARVFLKFYYYHYYNYNTRDQVYATLVFQDEGIRIRNAECCLGCLNVAMDRFLVLSRSAQSELKFSGNHGLLSHKRFQRQFLAP